MASNCIACRYQETFRKDPEPPREPLTVGFALGIAEAAYHAREGKPLPLCVRHADNLRAALQGLGITVSDELVPPSPVAPERIH